MSTIKDWLSVGAILAVGFIGGCVMLNSAARPGNDESAPLHRQRWEIDPQGQGENLSAEQCVAAGRTPYYIYPDNITPFYEECLR